MHSTRMSLLIASSVLAMCLSFPIEQKVPIIFPYANPDENRGNNQHFMEGDIVIDEEMRTRLFERQAAQQRLERHIRSVGSTPYTLSRKKRNANFKYYDTWYNRTIPYEFDQFFQAKPDHMRLVEAAMAVIENVTCVRFTRRLTERDYIVIVSKNSCHSVVGRRGGWQEVGLSDSCLQPQGVIIHELLHVLGLWHEQSRQDRDSYIEVLWDNIMKEHWENFEIRGDSDKDELFLRYPYDYGSVMHYSNTTFITDHALRNHGICLKPKQDLPKGVVMGQREGMSQYDIDKINTLYRCEITHCPDMPHEPDHGKVTGTRTVVGATVHYECDPSFTLIGSTDRVCRDDGVWSGAEPLCLATSKSPIFHYCNFEKSTDRMCAWRQAKNDDLNWTPNMEKTMSDDTGPIWDHTIGTAFGTYLYMEASGHSFGKKARLISPTFDLGKAKPCLVFYLYMYGVDMGNLTVYFTDKSSVHPVDSQLYTFVGEQGEEWKQVFIELDQAVGPFGIMLEASNGEGYRSDIAVDDIIIGECATLAPIAKSNPIREAIQCSFDYDLCDLLQSPNDQFNWTLSYSQTPTLYTGPSCDPLDCDNGQYLYIETSSPRRYGEKARIETPYIGGSGTRCLSFYYHMYGVSTGVLKVKQRSLLTGLEMILWEASGNQGNTWHHQHVSYTALNSYKIVFEGYVGAAGSVSYKGDIAIDEVSIGLGACSGALLFGCDFEHSVCGWTNSTVTGQSFQLDWRRHTGSTDTPDTGPSQDRSDPDGHYLYVESSRTLPGDLARLLSPAMESSSTGYCLDFYYHLYGQKSGNLTMYLQPEGGTSQQLWRIQGSQGQSWHHQQVNISSTHAAQEFRIMFEAALAGSTGDVALDDINIQTSACRS